MNKKHDPGIPLPMSIKGRKDLSKLLSSFRQRSDITYRLIEKINLSNVNLHQSLLTGTILRQCKFASVNFSRCDLDGMRIEQSIFTDCDFRNADMRSNTISNSTFKNCRFDIAYLYDCSLHSCKFVNCTFQSAAITHSSFRECYMLSNNLRGASFILNNVIASTIKDMDLGDCTFLYVIMKNCKFSKVSINTESIGMIYGITFQAIKNFQFLYLGERCEAPRKKDIVTLLFKEYERRRWDLGIALMRLNFKLTSPIFAIREYINSIQQNMKQGHLVKRDELTFFAKVLSEIAIRQKLPFLCAFESLEAIAEIIHEMKTSKKIKDLHSLATLNLIANSLSETIQNMLIQFECSRIQIDTDINDFPVKATIQFERKPETSLDILFNEIGSISGFSIKIQTKTIDRQVGSYLEVLSTSIYTLLGFQILLFLLNGCVIQVTELKSRFEVLRRSKLPTPYTKRALQPRQEIPTFLIDPIRNILKHFSTQGWLWDPKLQGLSCDNVKEIKIDS